MLIIGFSNQYCDLYYSENPNSKYAVDAIQLFIDSGKSVIFSQDTLSYVNVSPDHPFKDVNLNDLSDEGVPKQWGYYMNNAFRNVLAMDRYGVTADTDTTLSSALQKQGALLRQQQHLTVSGADSIYDKSVTVNQGLVYSYESDSAYGEDSTGSSQGYFLTRNVSTGNLSRLRDVAFAAGTYNGSKAQAYGQTQGFTNATLNAHLVSEQKQYLNLRNDLLPESNAGRDGMVKARVTQENEGLITHYPYEIGTEFQSSETHYPYYQLYVEQDEDTDNARKGDVVVWYCLSGDAANPDSEAGKIYCNSKNDVRNNYYLYRIKNVTYTGVGHSVLDHSGKDLETKLLVNTIVSAYGAKTLNPEIKLLESSDINSAEKKYEYILFDVDDTYQSYNFDAVNEGVISFYMLVKDDNFASNKRISVSFTRMTSSGEKSIGATLIDCETNREAYGSSLKEGHVYLVRIPKIIDQWERGKTEMEIKATLTSEFYYYGVQVKNQASTSFTVFKSTLFDLN